MDADQTYFELEDEGWGNGDEIIEEPQALSCSSPLFQVPEYHQDTFIATRTNERIDKFFQKPVILWYSNRDYPGCERK